VILDFDYRNWYTKDTSIYQDIRFVEERMSGSNFLPIVVSPLNTVDEACTTVLPSLNTNGVNLWLCLTDAQVTALWKIRDNLRSDEGLWARELIPGEDRPWSEGSLSVLDLAFATRGESATQIMDKLQCFVDGGEVTTKLRIHGIEVGCVRTTPLAESHQRAQIVSEQLRTLFNVVAHDPAVRGRHTQVRMILRQDNGSAAGLFVGKAQNDLEQKICG